MVGAIEQSTKDYHELTLERRIAATREEIDGSGLFGPMQICQHAWIVEYDAPRYLSYLDSDSGRLCHPQHVQDGLKADVAAAIARLGGTVHRGFVAVLALAQSVQTETGLRAVNDRLFRTSQPRNTAGPMTNHPETMPPSSPPPKPHLGSAIPAGSAQERVSTW